MLSNSNILKRYGNIIEMVEFGVSVSFYPKDKDKTHNAIIDKFKELGEDYTQNTEDAEYERYNIEKQLMEIYIEYEQEQQQKSKNHKLEKIQKKNDNIAYKYSNKGRGLLSEAIVI